MNNAVFTLPCVLLSSSTLVVQIKYVLYSPDPSPQYLDLFYLADSLPNLSERACSSPTKQFFTICQMLIENLHCLFNSLSKQFFQLLPTQLNIAKMPNGKFT